MICRAPRDIVKPSKVWQYARMTTPNDLLNSNNLLPTADQLELIRYYNDDYWQGTLTDEQINSIPVNNEPQQDLRDLRILHVDFGPPEVNIASWRKVYMASAVGNAHWNSYYASDGTLSLRENTRTYAAGIHEVRLDLAANNDTTPMEKLWQQTSDQGILLAHAELLSAMGLHRCLLKPHPRGNLTPVLGGYSLAMVGRERPQSLRMDTDYRRWGIGYYSSTVNRQNSPVPVLLG